MRPSSVPKEVGVVGRGANADNAGMTTTDRNKQVVQKFIQGLFTDGDLSAVERYLAPDFVAHDPPMPDLTGDAAGFEAASRIIRAAFPDWRSEVHLLVAEGDYVAEHFTASGTHRGDFMGAPATNLPIRVAGINLFALRDGKITARWGILDMASFFAQLRGVVASPGV